MLLSNNLHITEGEIVVFKYILTIADISDTRYNVCDSVEWEANYGAILT